MREKLLPLIEAEWAKAGFTPSRSREEILAAIDLLKPRARNLKDFATVFRAYFSDDFEYDPAAVTKFLSDGTVRAFLVQTLTALRRCDGVHRSLCGSHPPRPRQRKRIKAGGLVNGSRVALTGQAGRPASSPSWLCSAKTALSSASPLSTRSPPPADLLNADRCTLCAGFFATIQRAEWWQLPQFARAVSCPADQQQSVPAQRQAVVFRKSGDVVQLVRMLPCHGRGRGFEPRRPRHRFQKTYGIYGT